MKTRLVLAFLALTGLSACAAISEPGWTGDSAVPFNSARDYCRRIAAEIENGEASEAAFYRCMAEQGWTPGSSG